MTRQKICHWFAPSTRAASSSSPGKDMKNCRIKKVPNAENIPGTTSACIVFSQPKETIISNCGSRYNCGGTMSTDKNKMNSVLRPLNGIRAKAYPAKVQKACAT